MTLHYYQYYKNMGNVIYMLNITMIIISLLSLKLPIFYKSKINFLILLA